MTFDEAQSIGGQRSLGLESVGIENSQKKTLRFVHRSCPAIFALARDLVERGPLVFSEFNTTESIAPMSAKESKQCAVPELSYAKGQEGVLKRVVNQCSELRSRFARVAVITFDADLVARILDPSNRLGGVVHHIKERGELLGAIPQPGTYVMLPEACGGLEFDAVIIAGADDGRVPTPSGDLGPEAYLYLLEEAHTELYTAVTRSKYRVVFVCDSLRGPSPILKEPLSIGLIHETHVK